MARCEATATCPKFFLGLSGTEFWQLQGSPVLTDANGLRDLAQPANARIYYYSSTQHGGAGGVGSISYAPTRNVYPAGTVVHFNDTFRALFLALEDWVVRGTEPPPSAVPRIDNGTLVRPEALAFPAMRGLSWAVNGVPTAIPDFSYLARYNNFPLWDFGPLYRPQDESGIATRLPPLSLGHDYAILVPQVDAATGLTMAGVRSVEARAPLGTGPTPATGRANVPGPTNPVVGLRAPAALRLSRKRSGGIGLTACPDGPNEPKRSTTRSRRWLA